MYFFGIRLVNYAVEYFMNTDFTDPAAGDMFWGLFGPGNTVMELNRPFERLSDYEQMMRLLRQASGLKFEQMHKGTPFYLMSWLAFDLENFEKALFYIDAAISEDVRKTQNTPDPGAWKTAPGARFLLLAESNQIADRAIQQVRATLQIELNRFNAISGKPQIDIDTVLRFAEQFIDGSHRTIISAFYIFVMEYRERFEELQFRKGSAGGSNQRFTVYLLSGGLLVESLLKRYYPKPATHTRAYTIGSVFHQADFQSDLELSAAPEASADSLREIFHAVGGSNSPETAFSTAAKLRNTTAHDLVWDDVFDSTEIYQTLFEQIMNSILYIVDAKR